MGPTGCRETSVKNYHYTLRLPPEERRSHIHGGGSLEAPIFSLDFIVEPKALLINAPQAY